VKSIGWGGWRDFVVAQLRKKLRDERDEALPPGDDGLLSIGPIFPVGSMPGTAWMKTERDKMIDDLVFQSLRGIGAPTDLHWLKLAIWFAVDSGHAVDWLTGLPYWDDSIVDTSLKRLIKSGCVFAYDYSGVFRKRKKYFAGSLLELLAWQAR